MMNRIPIGLEVTVRFIVRVLAISAVAIAVALAALLLLPKAFGGSSMSVLSGSMAPAVNTGDMVAIIPQKASDIEVGEIVAFNDPNGTGRLYQHRVQYVAEDGPVIKVITKGDSNTAGEEWQARPDDEVGKVVLVVPMLGFAIGRLSDGDPVNVLGREIPPITLALTILVFLVGAFVIVGILRAPGDDSNDDDLEGIVVDSFQSFSTPSDPQNAALQSQPQQEVHRNA